MTDLYEISLLSDAEFDARMRAFEDFADFDIFVATTVVGEPTEEALTAIVARPLDVFTPSTVDRYGRAVDDLDPQYMTEEDS